MEEQRYYDRRIANIWHICPEHSSGMHTNSIGRDYCNNCFQPKRDEQRSGDERRINDDHFWRTLVRVVGIEEDKVIVIIPDWSYDELIEIPLEDFPSDFYGLLKKDFRCYVKMINSTTAENIGYLIFKEWEIGE